MASETRHTRSLHKNSFPFSVSTTVLNFTQMLKAHWPLKATRENKAGEEHRLICIKTNQEKVTSL